ncbi:MAG TPA: DEAD/DEAH box helicase family protein [Edaphobacter sp.]|uniref:DEAD/DEAH box helicase family protein n=1 Tax=Edaphobacter sp. TaxID=1934404 RepID=UPI002B69E440|nr:DEAD/DEAH box helicase family protein [Edaphobacter sp.]HUZ97526.1 DEAD/DEAH box helicase family protein [Edaphobacter sp.]
MTDANWLSLEEAATYIGAGKTVLYTLAREGRIPANKVGKKWTFEREQLDLWMRSSKPIEAFFTGLEFSIESNPSLREPQRDGYALTFDFFKAGKNKAILQVPVGCGKTGLAALLPLGIAKGRALVIAPNITIKDGLYEAMDITNRPKCFWRKAGVVSDAQMISGPLACTLDTGNITVASKCHIVITNIHQLATTLEKWLLQFPDDFFDMVIIDEAHHSAADSWKRVLERFPKAKVVYLTATPFRSDRQEIDGELVYRYSFRSATLKGYIKRLKASYVAPSEIELSFSDERGRTYSLDEVVKLKEEDWFSRGVALAPLCNKNIVNASLEKLEELRQTGTRHQLIAAACSINHARDIRSMYAERGYSADIVHSKQEPEEQKKVLAALRNGTLDCIIQVWMLGEGFDHPHLSVAAIFRPFRSLAPYIQFVGRIMRVVVQNDPTHPDNLGHIVTHLGMNIDQRLKEFKQFERDDEAFWDKVIGGEEPELPAGVRAGDTRLSASETAVVVRGEIVDSLWEEDFATIEDQQIVADLRERLKLLGLDPNQAEEIVKKSKPGGMVKRSAAESFPIQPQRALEEARKRVGEQSHRLAKVLLNHVQLQMEGREIPYKYTSLGITGRSNFVAAVMMLNHEINKRLGKDRDQCSVEDFQVILDGLDDILQVLVRRVRKAKIEHEKRET